jgi:DNA-binding LacI/PurR family transcriptional regulator
MATTAKPLTRSAAIYTQIEGRLRHKIGQGEWPAGAMLPSRRDLAKEYGVSSLTIDRAVTRLIAEGLLRADDRRGTFVTRAEEQGIVARGVTHYGTVGVPVDDNYTVTGQDKPRRMRRSAAPATIGIVATMYLLGPGHHELNNFWVRSLLQSLEHASAEDSGGTTQFCNRVQPEGHALVPMRDAIATLVSDGVDAVAVIALGTDPAEVDDSLSVLDGCDMPVVCVTSGGLSRPVPHLFYDNRVAGYQAAEHLLRRGDREILFVAPFTAWWVKERLEGVRAAVAQARLPADVVRVFSQRTGLWMQEEDPEQLGCEAGLAAFEEGLVRGGIVCVNDGVALGFLNAVSNKGLVAGSDFALVSFDDHPEARTAGLTTMRPPMEIMGREAARLLSRALQGETTDLQVRLRMHLIPRRSTRPAGSKRGTAPV